MIQTLLISSIENRIDVRSKQIISRRILSAVITHTILHIFCLISIVIVKNFYITNPLRYVQDSFGLLRYSETWVASFIFFLVLILQIVLVGENYMRSHDYASSRFNKLCYFLTPYTLLLGILHLLLGGFLTWFHLFIQGKGFYILSNYNSKNKSCHFEENYFILIEGMWIGLYSFIANFPHDISKIYFPIIPISKFSHIKRAWPTIIQTAINSTVWPTIYFILFYYLFGYYYEIILMSRKQISFNEMFQLFNTSLLVNSFLNIFFFQLIINNIHFFVKIYLVGWKLFIIETKSALQQSEITLEEALQNNELPIIQQLGFLDLQNMAKKDKVRRSSIFMLSQPGGHPYLWNNITKRTLLILTEFSKQLEATCSKENITLNQKTIHVQDTKLVYKMRNLLSVNSFSDVHLENLKSISNDNPKENFINNLRRDITHYLLSKPLFSYMFGEILENKVKLVLSNAQSVIWASEAISNLAIISLKEDPYGIVQKDVVNIIQVLFKVKLSLDKLQKSNILIRKSVGNDKYLKHTIIKLRSTIRRSIYLIICHFKQYIEDLDFPLLTKEQMQSFITFKD